MDGYRKAKLSELVEDPTNARLHDAANRSAIRSSLSRFGQVEPLVVRRGTGVVVGGNGRLSIMRELGWDDAEIREVELSDAEAKALGIALNRTAELATWDSETLRAHLKELTETDFELGELGFDDLDFSFVNVGEHKRATGRVAKPPAPTLFDRFLIPPFSILDARAGYWRTRAEQWMGLGVRGEVGRSEHLLSAGSDTYRDPALYYQKREVERELGRELSTAEFLAEHYENRQSGGGLAQTGTSVFDPVLCELVYRWFSRAGHRVLDPFAGGAVRGIVAAKLGRRYAGVELRSEQVDANRRQANELVSGDAPSETPEPGPSWAKGFALDDLRAVRALFDEHDAGIVQGAFTKVKEANVADWLSKGSLRVWKLGGELVAAAVVTEPKASRSIVDFSGQAIAKTGELQVSRVAFREGFGNALVAGLEAVLGEETATLEIWQESKEAQGVARALGFAWAGSKVRASSEIVGVWTRGTEEVESSRVFQNAHLVRVGDLELDVAPLRARLDSIPWEDHYSGYNKRSTWKAATLRGYGGRADFVIKPSEMAKKWKKENPEKLEWELADTDLRAELPEAAPLIDAIPGVKHRIRLMLLTAGDGKKKGGELSRHADITDPDAGVLDGQLMRIHIPIVTSDAVLFDGWDLNGRHLRQNFAEGRAWYLDTRKPHRATNEGDVDRVHLVLDVEANDELRELLQPFEGGLGPDPSEAFAWLAKKDEGIERVVFQAEERPDVGEPMPEWIEGDARDAIPSGPFDLVFSCPPYADLEVYSDDPRDLSTVSWPEFLAGYRLIVERAVAELAEDRFAVFVVGEVRGKDGTYRGLVPETIRAFEDAGASFYNEAILVTQLGSLPIRIARIFSAGRKIGKTHQNVLVFCKGDPKKAADACGTIEVPDAAEAFGEVA